MTVSKKNAPLLVESIPDPATIRQRLDELRSEARILRELLPVAERRQRMVGSVSKNEAAKPAGEGERR